MQREHLLPTEGFVRLRVVLKVIPVGRSTWLKGVKEGAFPQPVYLGPRIAAWKVSEIRALIDAMDQTRGS